MRFHRPQLFPIVLITLFTFGTIFGDDDDKSNHSQTIDIDTMPFIYWQTPINLIDRAQQIGSNERRSYFETIAHLSDINERKESYNYHIRKCNQIGDEMNKTISDDIYDQDDGTDHNSKSTTNTKSNEYRIAILQAIGIEPLVASFMIKSSADIADIIKKACIKNELQLQCGYAFVANRTLIEQQIDLLKNVDGNYRLMVDIECVNRDFASKIHACMGDSAPVWTKNCRKEIISYNASRTMTNRLIDELYHDTLAIVAEMVDSYRQKQQISTDTELGYDNKYANVNDNKHTLSAIEQLIKPHYRLESTNIEGDEILDAINVLLHSRLDQIRRIESIKCKQHREMIDCLQSKLFALCGPIARNFIDTILRIGYLQKERGERLHQYFEQMNISPHFACRDR